MLSSLLFDMIIHIITSNYDYWINYFFSFFLQNGGQIQTSIGRESFKVFKDGLAFNTGYSIMSKTFVNKFNFRQFFLKFVFKFCQRIIFLPKHMLYKIEKKIEHPLKSNKQTPYYSFGILTSNYLRIGFEEITKKH